MLRAEMKYMAGTKLSQARRSLLGGSDARIIMGEDEPPLVRLWREKRGEIKPEDLSGNLIVQLGVVTEPLNRHWFERNTGQTLKDIQRRIRHPVLRWIGATLDGVVAETGAVFTCFLRPRKSSGGASRMGSRHAFSGSSRPGSASRSFGWST
jgi:predicted phage-related endonuclease